MIQLRNLFIADGETFISVEGSIRGDQYARLSGAAGVSSPRHAFKGILQGSTIGLANDADDDSPAVHPYSRYLPISIPVFPLLFLLLNRIKKENQRQPSSAEESAIMRASESR